MDRDFVRSDAQTSRPAWRRLVLQRGHRAQQDRVSTRLDGSDNGGGELAEARALPSSALREVERR